VITTVVNSRDEDDVMSNETKKALNPAKPPRLRQLFILRMNGT